MATKCRFWPVKSNPSGTKNVQGILTILAGSRNGGCHANRHRYSTVGSTKQLYVYGMHQTFSFLTTNCCQDVGTYQNIDGFVNFDFQARCECHSI